MSRFLSQLPFTPAADFVALRDFTLNGVNLRPGDPVDKSGLGDRRLRFLYEQRKIAPVVTSADGDDPDRIAIDGPGSDEPAGQIGESPAGDAGEDQIDPADGAPPVDVGAGDPLPVSAAAGDDPTPPAATAPSVQKIGMGGWRVVAADGAPIGPSYKTRAAAEKALTELAG